MKFFFVDKFDFFSEIFVRQLFFVQINQNHKYSIVVRTLVGRELFLLILKLCMKTYLSQLCLKQQTKIQ